jgi:hypothetical protein
MRKGEIRGFFWENYHDDAIWVTQSVWERFVTEPKTHKAQAQFQLLVHLRIPGQGDRDSEGIPMRIPRLI